ncbi:myb-binding protein 1A-like protein [Epargyreus clarus]|uniref:myb-binding protein 1A-like protein n=1 Tax=Epargyreus clarus TaxID=520877 RepID=UPI003C30718E
MKDESPDDVPKPVTPSLLDAFDLLRSHKDDEKVIGGIKIISQLQGNENEKDIQYALKRLVRSLGANTPELRTGYFATLVNLLMKVDQINVSQLFDLVKKELHASGASKSEVGDVSLGQILVCGAIFRSGLMLKCTDEEHKEIIQLLRTASSKKSYLSTVAYLILLDFVNELDEEQFSSIVWGNIKQEFKKDVKEHTLDSLYFLLVVNKKFPAKVKLRKLIGVAEVLCEDNIHDICEKLMTGIDFNSISHPVYKEISTEIATSPHLLLFWTEIDNQLTKHNRNRELASINILNTILLNINDNTAVIPDLISQNFFKLFLDWFKGLQMASKIRNKREDEDDHKIMIKKEKELLNTIAKALKGEGVNSKTRVETLKKLLFNPGEINFTDITGSTVVKSIMADLDASSVKKMAKLLKGVLLNTSKKALKGDNERNWYNNERTKAAELISSLVSHEAVKDDTEFKITYMKLLMCFGFFKIGGEENMSISSELSGSIKTYFYRCFTSRFSNVENLVAVLSSLNSFITSILEKEEVRAKLEKQFPKENMECREMLTEICQKIEEVESKSKVDNVFLILLYQLGLFLFSEPTHVKIATSSIKELKSCYEHYKKGKKKKNKSLTDEPEWIEVLVEVLLSILSVESSVLRSVVQCVFRLLGEYLTPSSIGQIVSVLDPESEANPLINDSDSDVDKDELENENSLSDQDSDENDVSDRNGGELKDEDDDSDSSLEDDDDDENMKTPEQLRLAVQKALGATAADTDTESIDADMIDEEEGRKLDDALAEAFKQFHQGKNKKSKKERKNKKALSDFRIRVLDLIDIYVEKDPALDICLGMVAPLTRCLELCIQDSQFSELENRLRKTLKNLTKLRKFSSDANVTIDILCDYLKAMVAKGARSHFLYQSLGDVITCFATFIIGCSQRISQSPKGPNYFAPMIEVFKDSMESFFLNRNCMLPIIFFHSILRTDWEGNLYLISVIIDNAFNKNVRQFRRNEGLELMVGFYRSLNRYKPTKPQIVNALQKLETKLSNAITSTLTADSEFEVKMNFITTLKKLLNTIRAYYENCKMKSILQYEPLLSSLQAVKCTIKSKNKKTNEVQSQQNNTKSKKKKNKRKLVPQANGNKEPAEKKPRKISTSNDE